MRSYLSDAAKAEIVGLRSAIDAIHGDVLIGIVRLAATGRAPCLARDFTSAVSTGRPYDVCELHREISDHLDDAFGVDH